MTDALRREERRLRRIFRRALWIAVAGPIAIPFACGTQDAGPKGGGGGPPTSAGLGGGGAGGAMSQASSGSGDLLDGGADSGDASEAGLPGNSCLDKPGDAGAPDGSCAQVECAPNPPDECGKYLRLPCGVPANVVQAGDCFLFLNDCHLLGCPDPFFNCHSVDKWCVDGGIVPDETGAVVLDCSICPGGVGRVPAGLSRARRAPAASPLGDYFAASAHLEAASVHAFQRLHGELAAHRAPSRLLRATRSAQRDEVRHARLAGRMARRFGGAPPRPRVKKLAPRALDVVAIENAIEGCVRETFGALLATFQAANARDPGIARLMATIARDETRHAALSWAIARWASQKLDADARALLVARCREAVESLLREANANHAPELIARAGLPNAEQHRALVVALEEQLWAGLRS